MARFVSVGPPERTPPTRCAEIEDDPHAAGASCDILPAMSFEILGEISQVEVIAIGSSIRDLERLRKCYGRGQWRKVKGVALVRLASGRVRRAEFHWYEAHGLGRKEIKRKRYLDDA